MKLTDLKTTMDTRFEEVDQRLEQVDRRFEQVDRRFDQVDQRFDQVDQRLEQADRSIAGLQQSIERLEQRMISEGEQTRRHFDVVSERMIAERNLVLDQSLANSERLTTLEASNAADHGRLERRLDNHEGRLAALESTDPRTNP